LSFTQFEQYVEEFIPKDSYICALRFAVRPAASCSDIPLELTLPKGREYIPGMVKRGDSSAGAVIRGVPEKANSYP